MSLSFKAFSMYNLVALAWNMPRPLGEELIKEYNCDRIKGESQGRHGGRKPHEGRTGHRDGSASRQAG